MDAINAAYPALKPWMEGHRAEFLGLFNDYHDCQAKGAFTRALVFLIN